MAKEIKAIQIKNNMILTINKAERIDASQIIEYLNIVGGESDNLLFGANGFPGTVESEEDKLYKKMGFVEMGRNINFFNLYLQPVFSGMLPVFLHKSL